MLEESGLGKGPVMLEFPDHGRDRPIYVPVSTECLAGPLVPVSPQPIAPESCINIKELSSWIHSSVQKLMKKDDLLSDSSFDSSFVSSPHSGSHSIGVGVRIHLEPWCNTIPIKCLVSIPKGLVLPTISWHYSWSSSPILLMSRVMYGPVKITPRRMFRT